MLATEKLKRFRWPGLALVILFVYLLAGFVVLPHLLKNYLTETFAQKTGYAVTVGNIELNPFSWHLRIDDFDMHDANHKKLLAFGGLQLDYDGLSFLRGEYGIESFALDKPYIDLAINNKGELLLATVLAKLSDPDTKNTEEPSIPALLLEQLTVTDGIVDISTAQLARPYQQTFRIPHFQVNNFHTIKDKHANQFLANIAIGEKGSIDLTATMNLVQKQVQGELHIKQVDIQPALLAMALPFKAYLAALPLDVTTGFTLQFKDKLLLQLKKSDVKLHNIRISQSAGSPILADIPLLHVQGIAIDLPHQKLVIHSMQLADGKLQLAIDKAGQNNWQALLPADTAPGAATKANTATFSSSNPAATPSATSKKTSANSGWQVSIRQLKISNHHLQLHNEKTTTPIDMALSPINITLKDFEPLNTGKAFPVQLEIGLPEQGSLTAEAQVQQQPLQVSGKAKLQAFALPLVQAYMDEMAYVDIKKGRLTTEVDFTMQDQQQEQLLVQANGNILVDDFQVRKKGSKKKLLAWQQMGIAHFNYDSLDNKLAIDSINLQKAYGRLIISEAGETNVQKLLVEKSSATAPAITTLDKTPASANTSSTANNSKPQPALAWIIGVINFTDSEMGFTDLSLQPSFKTSIKNMAGNITHVSSEPNEKATVKLKGKVDEYAPVNIAGTFNLSVEKPRLNMLLDFKNIELTSFTPYSGVYAGYVIDKGQLSMELKYALVNNRILGKNHVVINQLVFGEKVKSNKVIDLPLRLAIALLSDENGVIDLGFDVKGDVNEPQFSINKIIWKALFELVKKTVSAPFTYLGGLFKAEQEDMQSLDFTPGSEDVSPDTANKLATVAKFLQNKKMLQLKIQGNALPAVDKPALQEKELLQILAVETAQNPELFLPRANPAANKELYDIVADYYQKQRAEKLSDVEKRLAEEWHNDHKAINKEELKKAAYGEAWETLVETTPVTDDDINALALRRAQQAKALLIDKYQIDAGRIFVMDSKSAAIAPSLKAQISVDAR